MKHLKTYEKLFIKKYIVKYSLRLPHSKFDYLEFETKLKDKFKYIEDVAEEKIIEYVNHSNIDIYCIVNDKYEIIYRNTIYVSPYSSFYKEEYENYIINKMNKDINKYNI